MTYRLLAITQGDDDPATRYRLGQYRPRLLEQGIEVESVAWPREESARLSVLSRADQFDGVVVCRRLMRVGHVKELRRRARRLAYDFDDCVTRRDSSLGIPWRLLDKVIQFRAMMASADVVTAGNAHLAQLARACGARGRVEVVPTTIDLARYPLPLSPIAGTPPVLGWIGQPTTAKYLHSLRRPLEQLSERFPGLTVRCVGASVDLGPRVRVESRDWNGATELEDLRSFTVGLAPLTDDAWTRGKCGLRLLQYLAAGVPAVADAVGVQREIVQTGAALGAHRPEDWTHQVTRLLRDPSERARLSRLGRKRVESTYTADRGGALIRELWCGASLSQSFRPAA